ncbi:MAG: hypothetical protein IK100_08260 [Muribaculaceae bacterium]|nr:hypothetical protein [Muribaculaceae bacterium]
MKTMTTIRTSSSTLFQVMRSYLSHKRVTKSTNFSDDIYSITIYDLDSEQTDKLLAQLTRRMHFLPASQAVAA